MPATITAEGLRARKKRETRDAIAASATALFARRGFEATTISDVAREANVSKMTVTNYFALKEDLVFDRRAEIVARLATAVRERGRRTVLQALRDVLAQGLQEHDPTYGFIGPRFADLVLASSALTASERSMFGAQECALAIELSPAPGDVEANLAAAALASVFRVLYYEGRRRMLAGEPTEVTVRALSRLGAQAFDRIAPSLPAALA